MFEKEIKVCEGCGEEDLIEMNRSFCAECLEKRRIERKKMLSI